MSRPAPVRRYVLVGSGVTAISAAQEIRALDPAGQIHIVSDDPAGYYSRPGLAYYLTGELGEDVLFPFTKKDFFALNLTWHTERVEQIFPGEHRVLLSDGRSLPYDRLLLATGSLAVPARVPGAGLRGVVKLDSLEDARTILRSCHRARNALVVGGGITALELVEGLRARGLKVHYFLRGERYWSSVLDVSESQIVESRLLHDGVHIHYQTELAEIEGRNNQVSAAITQDGQRLPCDLLAVAIGVRPRMELAQAAGLAVERGVLVDEYLQSSSPDIFAAGDVAQVFDPFSGKSVLDTLWTTARQQGAAAGQNMAGRSQVYTKSVPLNVTRLAGLTTTIIGTVGAGRDPSLPGINRGDSETFRQLSVHSVAETRDQSDRLRLLVGEQRLLGAVIMGDQALSAALQDLVAQQVDIRPIRAALLEQNGLHQHITSFWNQWSERNANPRS